MGAKWWELAIPVIGTLSGVSVTSIAQNLSSDRQQKHDRAIKLMEDKKQAYSSYVTSLDRLEQVVSRLNASKAARETATVETDKVARDLKTIYERIERYSGEAPPNELGEQLKKASEELERLRVENTEGIDEVDVLDQEVKEIECDVQATQSIITFLGSKEVRMAAASLSQEFQKRQFGEIYAMHKEKFIIAARKDLGSE